MADGYSRRAGARPAEAAGLRARPFRGLDELGYRSLDGFAQQSNVRRVVVVTGHAEAEPAVIGEDRHADAHVSSEWHVREAFEHAPPGRVQGLLGAGDVRGDGVHVALRHVGGGAQGDREQHRGSEAGQADEDVARHCLVRALQVLHLLAHRGVTGTGSPTPTGSSAKIAETRLL